MKELSDSEFDRILKRRVQEYDPLFEEEAWEKMEKKLRRRDRIVFFQRSSAVVTLFVLMAAAFFFYKQPQQEDNLTKKKNEQTSPFKTPAENLANSASDSVPRITADKETATRQNLKSGVVRNTRKTTIGNNKGSAIPSRFSVENPRQTIIVNNITIPHLRAKEPDSELPGTEIADLGLDSKSFDLSPSLNDLPRYPDTPETKQKKSKTPKKIPVRFGLAFSAGPDFNSTKALIGNKPTMAYGVLLNTSFSKITIGTGLRYNKKLYETSAAAYGVKNPDLLKTITYVDGSCNVLEIPLRLSYTAVDQKRKSIRINGGLSSYLMLKEKYVFKYTPESNIKDYTLEKRNANQHSLEVLDLSVTYRFKPKNSKINLGIEPYMKVPLHGVGEGKVKLRSTGITLNISYDLPKKKTE